MSASAMEHWGLRRRRSPVRHAALDAGAPRVYSMPCSPQQLAEDAAAARGRKRRRAPVARVPCDELMAPADGAPCTGPAPTRLALLVKEPWASLLSRGQKVWELRGARTHKRGRVALVASRTGGWVVGGATLVACHGPLTQAQLAATEALHCVPQGASAGRYSRTFAWEFAHAAQLTQPLRYDHPNGAVIWVSLDQPVTV